MANYKYPAVEQALQHSNLIALEDGCHSVFAIDLGEMKLVYKPWLMDNAQPLNKDIRRKIKCALKTLEAPIRNYYESKIGFLNHREIVDDTFEIESFVLEEWNKRGIPSIQVLEKQEKALVYKYLNAINFEKALKNEDHKSPKYTQLLDLTTKIRQTAKSEGNPLLLHPDLLPRNFLYLIDENKTIAIDPGLKLKNSPIEELDARINLLFLYDVNKFDSRDGYIDKFLERLTKDEIRNIREFNNTLRRDVTSYFNTRKKIVSFLRGKPAPENSYWLNPNNTEHINKLLERHI